MQIHDAYCGQCSSTNTSLKTNHNTLLVAPQMVRQEGCQDPKMRVGLRGRDWRITVAIMFLFPQDPHWFEL